MVDYGEHIIVMYLPKKEDNCNVCLPKRVASVLKREDKLEG